MNKRKSGSLINLGYLSMFFFFVMIFVRFENGNLEWEAVFRDSRKLVDESSEFRFSIILSGRHLATLVCRL